MTTNCRIVKVVDGRERPMVGAQVSLAACDVEAGNCTPPDIPSREWWTDRNGRICAAELLGMDGGGALEVTAPEKLGGRCLGWKHWAYPKGVPGARGTAPIVVKLDAPPLATGRLKGRVRSADGRPVKGARVNIQSIFVGDGCSFEPDQSEVTSSADGQFSFSAVAKGTATLEIKHLDFEPRTADAVVPSAGVDIVLEDGASWRGRVLDPDGRPLTDCKAVTLAGTTWSASGPCPQGSFSLRHLPAGNYEVGVATDEPSDLGARFWKTKTRIAQAEHRIQELSWPRGVTLTGVIVDQAGSPIAGARLSATPEPWDGRPDREVIVRADAAGRFAFRHLVPGHWEIKGDYRAVLTGAIGKLDVDATTNREGLRLIVPETKGR